MEGVKMTEIYPDDSELVGLEFDDETGVEYIATGQAPYYLHFRKLLYRLLLATKRCNDFRVFDEGGLSVGVKAGSFWFGNALVEYEGSSGNHLADDREAIYLYVKGSGELVVDEYVGFPDMGEVGHLRLAIVRTGGGGIVDIKDCRGSHLFTVGAGGGV